MEKNLSVEKCFVIDKSHGFGLITKWNKCTLILNTFLVRKVLFVYRKMALILSITFFSTGCLRTCIFLIENGNPEKERIKCYFQNCLQISVNLCEHPMYIKNLKFLF